MLTHKATTHTLRCWYFLQLYVYILLSQHSVESRSIQNLSLEDLEALLDGTFPLQEPGAIFTGKNFMQTGGSIEIDGSKATEYGGVFVNQP